jgi:hypothetical protein
MTCINKFNSEKEKIDQISKKDVANYKTTMEELEGHLKESTNAYEAQAKICKDFKKTLQSLIDSNSQYEKLIETFEKEEYHIKLIERMNRLKGNNYNYGFNSANKSLKLTEENQKIQKKLALIKEDINKINSVLLQNVILINLSTTSWTKKSLLWRKSKKKKERKS